MQNSIWKFAALTGVVGIGLLVMLQAQRGLSRRAVPPEENVSSNESATRGESAAPPGVQLGAGSSTPRNGENPNYAGADWDDEAVAFGQYEPPVEPVPSSTSSRNEDPAGFDAAPFPSERAADEAPSEAGPPAKLPFDPSPSTEGSEDSQPSQSVHASPAHGGETDVSQGGGSPFTDDPIADRKHGSIGSADAGTAPHVSGGETFAGPTGAGAPMGKGPDTPSGGTFVNVSGTTDTTGPRLLTPEPVARPIDDNVPEPLPAGPDSHFSNNATSSVTAEASAHPLAGEKGHPDSPTDTQGGQTVGGKADDIEVVSDEISDVGESASVKPKPGSQPPALTGENPFGSVPVSSTAETETEANTSRDSSKPNSPTAPPQTTNASSKEISAERKPAGSTEQDPSPRDATDLEPDPSVFEGPSDSAAASADSSHSPDSSSQVPVSGDGSAFDISKDTLPSLSDVASDSDRDDRVSGDAPDDDSTEGTAGASTPEPTTPESEPQSTPEETVAQPSTASRSGSTEASGEPQPLSPPPDAAPLNTVPPEKLQGDGVVDDDAPRGPQQARLQIEKLAPETALLGRPLVYSILVRNVGKSAAHQVTVEDRIPKGSKLSGTIPQAEMTKKRLIWKLGTLIPGDEKKISVRVVPMAEGQIGSIATVNFVSEVAAETMITAPQLKLDVEAPKQARLGEPVVFHFQVTNSGRADADDVVIRDLVPEGLSHPHGKDLEYVVGTLPAGESQDVKLTLTAAQTGRTVNRVLLTVAGEVSTEAQAPVTILGSRVALARNGPERQYLGRTAVYRNVLTNESDEPVRDATVIETIPKGMEFVQASAGGQYNPGQGTVAWRVAQLGPQESKVLKLTLRGTSPGTHTSEVKALEPDGRTVTVTSRTEVAGFTAVHLEVPPAESPVDSGEDVTLRIIARNRGSEPATNVRLKLTVPDETALVSAEGPQAFTQHGQQLDFRPIDALPGGEEAVFQVTLKARRAGDARLKAEIEADQMQRPLHQEAPILILAGDS